MRNIKDISELKQGDEVIHFYGDVTTVYEFLMVHSHNDKYVLMFEPASMDAVKVYIPNIVCEKSPYYIDFTWKEVYQHNIEWHERQIKYLKEILAREDKK